MTSDDLKTELFKLLKAKHLDYTIFPDKGSIHLTAAMVAGLSCTRSLFSGDVTGIWLRHYTVAKWLMHFDKRPGTICGAMAHSVLANKDMDKIGYKDAVAVLNMIPNVIVGQMIKESALVKTDPTLIPSVELQNISLAVDCVELASAIQQDSELFRLLVNCPPFDIANDLNAHRNRQNIYTLANPVLRNIHADLMEATINLHRK